MCDVTCELFLLKFWGISNPSKQGNRPAWKTLSPFLDSFPLSFAQLSETIREVRVNTECRAGVDEYCVCVPALGEPTGGVGGRRVGEAEDRYV